MSTPDYTAPDLAYAALVTIDVQQDVLDGGTLGVPGTRDALAGIERLTAWFRRAQKPIVHAIRLYSPDGEDVDLCRRSAVEQGARTLIAGSPGSQLAGALASNAALDHELLRRGELQSLTANEVAMYKPRWGAFYRTDLEQHLRERAITTIVFCGANFPNCPRTSIYEASERDFRIVLATDAISGLYDRASKELANIGVHLMSTGELLAGDGPQTAGRT
jgi:nicotinamidase-related amidase